MPPPSSSAMSWCASNGFFIEKNSSSSKQKQQNTEAHSTVKRPRTNLLMNGYRGGVLSIPDAADYITFLRLLADDYDNGINSNSVVEARPPSAFNMFFDLDINCGDAAQNQAVFELCRDTLLKELIPHVFAPLAKSVRVVVCTTRKHVPIVAAAPVDRFANGAAAVAVDDNDDADDDNKGTSNAPKLGAHIILPSVSVNTVIARHIRSIYMEMLAAHDAERPWATIVDESVYKGAGLRLVGQSKYARGVRLGRVYAIDEAYGGDEDDDDDDDGGYCARVLTDTRYGFMQCSIRHNSDGGADGRLFTLERVKKLPAIIAAEATQKKKKTAAPSTSKKRPSVKDAYDNNDDDDNDAKVLGEFTDRSVLETLNYWFREHLNEPDFCVRKIKRMAIDYGGGGNSKTSHLWPYYYTIHTNVHRCENNWGRPHNGATVYYTVHPRHGVCQRCHCKCEITSPSQRKHGVPCREYKSPRDTVFLPRRLMQVLFSDVFDSNVVSSSSSSRKRQRPNSSGGNQEVVSPATAAAAPPSPQEILFLQIRATTPFLRQQHRRHHRQDPPRVAASQPPDSGDSAAQQKRCLDALEQWYLSTAAAATAMHDDVDVVGNKPDQ